MGDRKAPTPPPTNQRKPPPPPAPPPKRRDVRPRREEDPAPLPAARRRPAVAVGPSPGEAIGQMLSMLIESADAAPGTRRVQLFCSIPMECPACKTMVPAWTKHSCQP